MTANTISRRLKDLVGYLEDCPPSNLPVKAGRTRTSTSGVDVTLRLPYDVTDYLSDDSIKVKSLSYTINIIMQRFYVKYKDNPDAIRNVISGYERKQYDDIVIVRMPRKFSYYFAELAHIFGLTINHVYNAVIDDYIGGDSRGRVATR